MIICGVSVHYKVNGSFIKHWLVDINYFKTKFSNECFKTLYNCNYKL